MFKFSSSPLNSSDAGMSYSSSNLLPTFSSNNSNFEQRAEAFEQNVAPENHSSAPLLNYALPPFLTSRQMNLLSALQQPAEPQNNLPSDQNPVFKPDATIRFTTAVVQKKTEHLSMAYRPDDMLQPAPFRHIPRSNVEKLEDNFFTQQAPRRQYNDSDDELMFAFSKSPQKLRNLHGNAANPLRGQRGGTTTPATSNQYDSDSASEPGDDIRYSAPAEPSKTEVSPTTKKTIDAIKLLTFASRTRKRPALRVNVDLNAAKVMPTTLSADDGNPRSAKLKQESKNTVTLIDSGLATASPTSSIVKSPYAYFSN